MRIVRFPLYAKKELFRDHKIAPRRICFADVFSKSKMACQWLLDHESFDFSVRINT